MIVSISTITVDPLGHVLLDALDDAREQDRRRRVTRIATLDGGAAFNEFGFSDADQSLLLRWTPIDATSEDAIDYMVRLYSRVNVSFDGRFFEAAIEQYTAGTKESRLSLLVSQRLDQ